MYFCFDERRILSLFLWYSCQKMHNSASQKHQIKLWAGYKIDQYSSKGSTLGSSPDSLLMQPLWGRGNGSAVGFLPLTGDLNWVPGSVCLLGAFREWISRWKLCLSLLLKKGGAGKEGQEGKERTSHGSVNLWNTRIMNSWMLVNLKTYMSYINS